MNFRKNGGNGNGKKRGAVKKIVIPIIAVMCASAVCFMWYNSKRASAVTTDISVTMERAQKMDIQKIISAGGTIEINSQTNVYGNNQGKIKSVAVSEGDKVEAGETLVTYDIDDTRKELEISLQKARITLKNAELSLQSITAAPSNNEIMRLENNISSIDNTIANTNANIEQTKDKITVAEKKAQDAQETLRKYTELYEAGGISEAEIKTFEKSYEDALSEIKDLENQISSYERSIKESENSKTQAELELDMAKDKLSSSDTYYQYQRQLNEIEANKISIQEIENSLAELTESTATSVGGVITTLNAEEGADINATTPIAVISDFDNLIVKAYISEYDAPRLKVGQKANITSDGFDGVIFSGELSKIGAIATEQSTSNGTETVVEVEISIDKNGELKPGYSVNIEIIADEAKDIIAVPIASVKTDRATGEKYVFVFDRGVARKTVITTGLAGDLYIQADGVDENVVVITNPSDQVADGVQVIDGAMIRMRSPGQEGQSTQGAQGGPGAPTMMFGRPAGGGGGGGVSVRRAAPMN